MEFTVEEIRVLGCLIEKSKTTPEQYPLSSNSLMVACNQKTSREPVVKYSQQVVDEAVKSLREKGFARTVKPQGSRGHKHKHIIEEALDTNLFESSILAVLMLRGAQSAGELKQRTDRYCDFEDNQQVLDTLINLSQRNEPLVKNIGRFSGQSQDRWIELLSPQAEPNLEVIQSSEKISTYVDETQEDNVATALEERVTRLEKRLKHIEENLF